MIVLLALAWLWCLARVVRTARVLVSLKRLRKEACENEWAALVRRYEQLIVAVHTALRWRGVALLTTSFALVVVATT